MEHQQPVEEHVQGAEAAGNKLQPNLEYDSNENSIDEIELRLLADQLGSEWESLATHLGFRRSEIDCFRIDGKDRGIDNTIFDILVTWQQRQPQIVNFRKLLANALKKVGRHDLAESTCPPAKPPTGKTTRHPEISEDLLNEITKELKQHYKDSVCKKRIYPWGGEWMDFNEIYLPVTIDRYVGPEAKPMKESLDSYVQLFRSEELEGHGRFYLTGAPGQGKSSFCAKVAYDWCAGTTLQNMRLLFIVDLADVNADTDVEDAICQNVLSNMRITPDKLREIILHLKESIFFIFDGLDEAPNLHETLKSNKVKKPDSGSVGSIGNRVTGVMKNQNLKECRVLITTRPDSEHVMKNIPGYKRLELKKLTRQNIETYVERFFLRANQGTLGDMLLKLIQSNNLTLDASTPLITLLMCFYWTETEGIYGIPERLKVLYDGILDILYKRQDQDIFTQEEIIEHLGQLASSCLTRYKTKIVFTEKDIKGACSDTDAGEQLLAQAKGMGILYRKGLGLQFFHKSGQEYCAGVYLANHRKVLIAYLDKIKSVQNALNLGMVLKFAACKTDAANLIVEKLIALFEVDPKCSQYYEEKEVIVDQDSDSPDKEKHPVLEYHESRTVQLFIELCLECIFEGDLKNQLCAASRSIFPAGQILFTGLVQKLVSSISYYMRHCGENVRTIHLYPIAHMKDRIDTIEKGAMREVFAQRVKANLSRQIRELQRVCRRFVEANEEMIRGDIKWQLNNKSDNHVCMARLAAYISCVEETQSQPSADEINFKPIIQNLQFCTNLQPPWICRLGHEGYFGLVNNHIYLLQQIVNDSISSHTLSVFTELVARDLTGEYGRSRVYDNASHVTRLMQSISHMTNLRRLNISNNILEPGIMTALVDSLPHCTQLQRLDMVGMRKMRHDDVIALCGAIEKLPKLRMMDLWHNRFTEEELQQLMTAAKKTNMQELRLTEGDGELSIPENVAAHFTDEFIEWCR